MNYPPRLQRRQRGFSLVELLTVIAVLGLLGALLLGISSGAFTSGSKAKAQAELAVLAASLEDYKAQYGDYPHLRSGEQDYEGQVLFLALAGYRGPRGDNLPTTRRQRIFLDFSRFTVEPALTATFNSDPELPATQHSLRDPWGRPYYYRYRMTGATPSAVFSSSWAPVSYVLLSAGADGLIDLPASDGTYDPTAPKNRDNVSVTR